MEKQFAPSKWFIFLAMFYVMTLITTQLLVHKIIYVADLYISVAVLIFPLSFTISDVITEVYGHQISKEFLWASLAVVFLFCLLTTYLIKLPIPPHIHHQHAYAIIFNPILRSFIACFVATMVGGFINIYFISKWKILLKGRYFWLRSIGSTLIGEFVFTMIADPMIFLGQLTWDKVLMIALTCYIVKIFYAIIFAAPATLCVNLLKQSDTLSIDHRPPLNPFAQKNKHENAGRHL